MRDIFRWLRRWVAVAVTLPGFGQLRDVAFVMRRERSAAVTRRERAAVSAED